MQIRAGADAIQIFDSWGGIVAGHDYEAASLQWIRRIVSAMPWTNARFWQLTHEPDLADFHAEPA